MKKVILVFGLISVISSCHQDLNESSRYVDASEFEFNKLSNYSQYEDLLYKHIKYYSATVDPFEYVELADEEKSKFKTDFNEFYLGGVENTGESRFYLKSGLELGLIQPRQYEILNEYLDELIPKIQTVSTLVELEELFDVQAELILDDKEMPDLNREMLLIDNYVAKAALKYYWERNFDPSFLDPNARIQACGFWDKAFCYLESVLGLASATAGMLGTASKASWGAGFWKIGALIGVAVGIYNGITSCGCDKNVCQSFQGVSVPFACYTYGNSLTFKGWGQGNIAPSSFDWAFYKNENLNTASNFYSGNSTGDTFVLPGSYINSSINTIAVRNIAYCSGIQNFSPYPFGWFDLSEIGKPDFVITGPTSIPVSQTGYNWSPQLYGNQGNLGQIAGETYYWELIPSGYPGFSATGTFMGPQTEQGINIRWNSNPGYATVKLTVTTGCSVDVKYLNVQIVAGQQYY